MLGASDGAAEAAERQAQVLVAQEPSNWSARATLGLARLRLGRKEDALKAFRDVRATGAESPGALAVRAAILAVNGYEKGARGDGAQSWSSGAAAGEASTDRSAAVRLTGIRRGIRDYPPLRLLMMSV